MYVCMYVCIYIYIHTHTYTYVCVCVYVCIYIYDMLALQLPLAIIKFETIICLLTRGEENNPKSNRTEKQKDPTRFFYKI